MRTLVLIVALGLAAPAQAFEGEIQAKAVGGGNSGSANMTILVSKKGDVSMETTAKAPDGGTYRAGYIKPVRGKFNYSIDHTNKTVTKVPKDMFDKMIGNQGKSNDKFEKANVEIKKLGKGKVAGVTCRHIRVIDKEKDGGTSDMWLADKYSAQLWTQVFAFGGKGPQDQMKNWNKAAKKLGFKPGFIMKMMHTDKAGRQGGLEVTKLKERKVNKKTFSPPDGYEVREVNMPPGGIGGMPTKMPTTPEEAEKMREEWMKKLKDMER